MPRIFVYGTLKSGGSNHHLMAGQSLVGQFKTKPLYLLYQLDGHPGMITASPPFSGVSVLGEVWNVSDKALAQLDILEEIETTKMFRRENVELLDYSSPEPVQVYLYNWSVENRKLVGSVWDHLSPDNVHHYHK